MCEARKWRNKNWYNHSLYFILIFVFVSFHHPNTFTCRFMDIFVKGIHSVQHEINFWSEKTRNASAKSDKETANAFAEAIDKINQLLRNVASISSLEEFLDTIHTHLDELWRLPQNYPQTRMTDLLDIICKLILHSHEPFASNYAYDFVICFCSIEYFGILFGSFVWIGRHLGHKIVASISNGHRYNGSGRCMVASVWFIDTFILAKLRSTCMDRWTAYTEKCTRISRTTQGSAKCAKCLQRNR